MLPPGQRDDFTYRDALPDGPARGRGVRSDPANRFEPVRLHVLGEQLDEVLVRHADGDDPFADALGRRQVPTRVYPDRTRSLINKVDAKASPDIPFAWTINPYRGCEHGCIYCYARPGHEYLGLGCGEDFETKIMAKLDAAEILRRELADPKWAGEPIVMSGVTDCYQPIEADLRLTRACLEVMVECGQPVSIVTKSRLVTRDLDLLSELASRGAAQVTVSVTTLDANLAAKMEPRASAPAARLDAIRQLARAGVPVTAMTAPIIPGLNDRELPALLEAVAEAGACHAGYVLLRLPWQIKDLFLAWLRDHFPERAERVESLLRQTRDGELYDARPFVRMRGQGPVAEQIRSLFHVFKLRHGLNRPPPALSSQAFRRPTAGGQMGLFE